MALAIRADAAVVGHDGAVHGPLPEGSTGRRDDVGGVVVAAARHQRDERTTRAIRRARLAPLMRTSDRETRRVDDRTTSMRPHDRFRVAYRTEARGERLKPARWILGTLLLAAAARAPSAWPRTRRTSSTSRSRRGWLGVYQADGRTLWIIRLPGRRPWRDPVRTGTGRCGCSSRDDRHLRLRAGGRPGERPPDRFDTVGLTPGLRFDIPTTKRWTLFPFAQGGPVRDFSTESTAWVYTVGLTSEARLPRGDLEWIVRGELAWSGMNPSGEELKETFGEFTQGSRCGVRFRHESGRPGS